MTPLNSPLPSPPTSPTTAAATRIRIKASRRPGSLSNISPRGERTRGSNVAASPDTPSSENRSTASAMVVGKRRQSSIAYYTPTSPSPYSQRPQFNNGHCDGELVIVNGNENISHRSSLALSPRSTSTRESVCSTDGVGTREREPLTLVEKHADLLHFIAQKERKCLELRDQLAAHEKELAELKRKWEHIVNHSHEPLPNSPLTASFGGVTFDGLKEGVRMIAAGFSDFSGVIQEFDSGDKDTAKVKPGTHAPRENHTTPNHAKQTGSQHLSMSSISSILDSVHDSDGEVVTAPSLSRDGSFNSRIHKRISRAFVTEELPTSSTSLDVRMSLILTPSPTLISPPLSSVTSTQPPIATLTEEPVPTITAGSMSSWMDNMGKKLSGLQTSPTLSTSQKRASSFLAGVSNTISAALLPGPTATTPAPLPQATMTRILPSAVSAPPLTSTTSSSSSSSSAQPYPAYKTMADWLDDHEDEHDGGYTRVPMSELKRQLQAQQATSDSEVISHGQNVPSFDDDNDWNW